MKIGIADSCALKFSRDIKEHWEAKGHEVRYEIGASEHIAQWADMYYCDFSDNNIHYLYKIYMGQHPEHPNGKSYKRPKFVVRAIDWDIYVGYARDQGLVDFVDQWICIAPHMEKKLRAEATYREGQLVLIRPGVNLDRFPLKTTKTDGFQLGMVLGDMWVYKNHMAGLDIFTTLYHQDRRWRLHIRGQHEPGEFNPVMFNHYLESRGIAEAVRLYDRVEDMNLFYEGIDILLHPGMKEAYCYAVGEAMAKGIPVVVNDFYGAKDIWGESVLYKRHDQAVSMIKDPPFNSFTYHDIIEKKHNIKDMLSAYDTLLGT